MTMGDKNPKTNYYKGRDGRLFRFRTDEDGNGDLYSKESPEKPWVRWAEGSIGGRFERKFARSNRLKKAKAEETGQEGESR